MEDSTKTAGGAPSRVEHAEAVFFTSTGEPLAKPFSVPKRVDPPAAMSGVTVQRESFKMATATSAGSKRKPLIPYKPNAARNRLKQSFPKVAYRNYSQIDLGNGAPVSSPFTTENQASYTTPPSRRR